MPNVVDILALREKRAQKVTEARNILANAEKENRAVNNEEKLQWDRAVAEVQQMKATIDTYEQQESMERELQNSSSTPKLVVNGAGHSTLEARVYEDDNMHRRSLPEYRKAWTKYLTRGRHDLNAEEYRALQADVDASGGYTVLPTKLTEDIIKVLDNTVFIRKLATKHPLLKAANLGVMKLDADPADADWTTELLTGNEDSTMAFDRRDLSCNPLAKRIKISNKVINLSTIGVENLVKSRLEYKFGITQEKAFLTGNGSGKPLGVYTASASGISTARDVSTGNTTTAITYAGLVNAKYKLTAAYRNHPSLAWNFHRDGVKNLMQLVDGESRPLWEPSIRLGEPDTLLKVPYYESEYSPNTFTTGLYVGIIGAWFDYNIVESLQYQIQRLNELYAETNQIGYIARIELDGAPMFEEAWARVKLA